MATQASNPVVTSDNKTLKRPNEPDIVSQQILDATESDRDGGEQPISVSAESAVTQLFKTFPYRLRGKDEDKARGDQGDRDKRKQIKVSTSTKKPSATDQTKDPRAPAKPKKPYTLA